MDDWSHHVRFETKATDAAVDTVESLSKPIVLTTPAVVEVTEEEALQTMDDPSRDAQPDTEAVEMTVQTVEDGGETNVVITATAVEAIDADESQVADEAIIDEIPGERETAEETQTEAADGEAIEETIDASDNNKESELKTNAICVQACC
jgi:hypothetical protein